MTVDRDEDFLLLKMLPEQVNELWHNFAPLIAQSLPPIVYNSRLRMANVLRSILMEELEVWVYYDENKQERYVVSSLIRTDPVSLGKDFLIYSFTSLGQIVPKHFENGLGVLKKYARANNCDVITAYVSDERIEQFLVSQGADNEFNLIQIEV